MNTIWRHIFLALPSILSAAYGNLAGAQTYSGKAVGVIVPFAPGGATDAVLRMLAPRLSENLGQQVVVENRPGGAATIGMDIVAKSAPNGQTLGVATFRTASILSC